MRPLIAIAVIIALLFIGKQYVFVDHDSPEAPQRSRQTGPLMVDVFVAGEVTSQNTIYASGTVVPNEEVSLQSEINGRLLNLNLREGTYVSKGEVIAKIDDRDLHAQLKKLSYEEELASQTEARQKKLLDIDAISKEEYDLSLNRVSTLSADRELLEVQLSKTEVRAPFSGYIGFKQISVGTYLTPGISIATLVQTHPIKIDFPVPEKYATQVQLGQEVTFEVDGQQDDFRAKIVAIDPKVDEDLRTLRVRAQTANRGRKLLPGMFVRVSVPLGASAAIMVPTEAIVPILKGKKVYVVQQGKASSREIETGVRTEQRVQVQSGLEIGDSIIVSSLMYVTEGKPVRVESIVSEPL